MPDAVQSQLRLSDTDLPALIVLGRDDTNKPHAAWFDGTEAASATSAAALMGMMALPVTTDEHRALAGKLPHGRIFGSGKAFVPFTRAALYDDLVAHVPMAQQVRPLRIVRVNANDESEPTGDGEPAPAPDTQLSQSPSPSEASSKVFVPEDWSKVGPGAVVLSVADDRSEGWFESVILKAKGNTSYTLRWRDYPDQPHFERPPTGIALMHPSRLTTD